MHKFQYIVGIFVLLYLANVKAVAQNPAIDPAIGNLIQDAIYFTDLYVSPAADAAVYQAASSWVNTPQKAELWDFTLGLHVNTFFVPKSDRSFRLNNSDLSFLRPSLLTTASGAILISPISL
jgi:hypothetical protein